VPDVLVKISSLLNVCIKAFLAFYLGNLYTYDTIYVCPPRHTSFTSSSSSRLASLLFSSVQFSNVNNFENKIYGNVCHLSFDNNNNNYNVAIGKNLLKCVYIMNEKALKNSKATV